MKAIKQLFMVGLLLSACTSDEILTPKPPTYLRLDLPDHEYTLFQDSESPYSFEVNKSFKVNPVLEQGKKTFHKDIDLGGLNGVMHFSYIPMVEPLSVYVNYANDKVEDHKLKATGIDDQQIIRSKDKVYGTFFKLRGDVASPFQFYLTDSVSQFASGVIYLNTAPNYDSLKPSLDYLEVDLLKFVETFKWKNK